MKLKARQEAKRVLENEPAREALTVELDAATIKLEIARARISTITEANIKELEDTNELSDEDKKKAIAQQRTQLDQAEISLENHVEWRQFVLETYNL